MVNTWVLRHLSLAQSLRKQDRHMDTLGDNRISQSLAAITVKNVDAGVRHA